MAKGNERKAETPAKKRLESGGDEFVWFGMVWSLSRRAWCLLGWLVLATLGTCCVACTGTARQGGRRAGGRGTRHLGATTRSRKSKKRHKNEGRFWLRGIAARLRIAKLRPGRDTAVAVEKSIAPARRQRQPGVPVPGALR